ncbi:MAG: restriction endonuclease subunit S [Acidobacteriota bacterium]|jgi:type I restriction enzyme S subunit
MIAGLKPYPAMKDSGVPWLGQIPAHWAEKRGKYFFKEVDERSMTGEEELLSVSHLTGVTPRSQKNVTMFKAESTVGHKLCGPGDVVVNTMWAWMAALGVAKEVGLVSPSYGVYRPHQPLLFLPEFIDHLLRTPPYVSEYIWRSTGITTSRLRLYPEQFLRIPLVCPPFDEQRLITRFVSAIDRLIRRYIRAKQELIKLLEEQKQAIIHRAVTCGLDPNVRLKPSLNQWFPETPEHWNVLPIRRVILRSVDGPHHSPEYLDAGIPFLSARNIKPDRWSLDDAKFVSDSDYLEFCKRVKPEIGDVLYTKGGTTGVARAVDFGFKFQVWVHVAVLKLDKRKITPDFLAAALNSPRCYEQSQLFTRGATNQDLGLGRMKDIVLPIPPLQEQEAIMAFVKTATLSLREMIDRAQREIALIREYRTRLIADVVTGRLDVREAAARLPEEDPLRDFASSREHDLSDVPSDTGEEPTDDLETTPEEAEA